MAAKDVLALETRKNVYDAVRKSPGSHLREVQRSTKLSFGSVSYHLSYLCRHRLIKEEKDGKNNRYFPFDLENSDQRLLSLLRQKSIRGILLFLVIHKEALQQSLSSSLNISLSTINWHLKKLEEEKIIGFVSINKRKTYSLIIDKNRIIKLLISYKESFLDSMINSAVDLVDIKFR